MNSSFGITCEKSGSRKYRSTTEAACVTLSQHAGLTLLKHINIEPKRLEIMDEEALSPPNKRSSGRV